MQRKKYLCCECQESVCSEVLVMKPLMQPPPALNGGPPSHYVAFHSVTSGLNGPDLGSDESDIVLLVFIVVDAKTKQVGNARSLCILYFAACLSNNCTNFFTPFTSIKKSWKEK